MEEMLQIVLAAAEEVLGCSVGPGDEFFEMGGDSVAAVEFGELVERWLQRIVNVAELAGLADFAAMARALTAAESTHGGELQS